MKLLLSLTAVLAGLCQHVTATAVFAHFMVDNSEGWSSSDWATEMAAAQEIGIDAFAMNMATGSSVTAEQVPTAFSTASSLGFQLFFSFDYAGNGAWPKDQVIDLLSTYGGSGAYYKRNGQPVASTFEGPGSAGDWADIKAQTGCFFIPDWSSLGANAAAQAADGVADGLFNWAAWPWGDHDMDTYIDASYLQYLSGKPYMMPISPWFYTNLPDKSFRQCNWAWASTDLWYQRWKQAIALQIQVDFTPPEFIEIISWNDFGESHYIGPQRSSTPFTTGRDAFDYVSGISHDGWRVLAKPWIQLFKTGTMTVDTEQFVMSMMAGSLRACSDGDTTVNTASQLQIEYEPSAVMHDYVVFDAVLAADADVTVHIGGTSVDASWTGVPEGGVGVYHGKVLAGANGLATSGAVSVELKRNGVVLATITGPTLGDCIDGYANMNAWVGSAVVQNSQSGTTPHAVSELACIAGTGAGDYASICAWDCAYGYCPVSACVCTEIGLLTEVPTYGYGDGYAKNDPNFAGLCSFSCDTGYCPEDYCTDTYVDVPTPATSPFTNEACTGGVSNGAVEGLEEMCEFSCGYGYCPIHLCTCTSQGVLNALPNGDISNSANDGEAAAQYSDNRDIGNLCAFTCQYGYCPIGTCFSITLTGAAVTGKWTHIYCDKEELTSDLDYTGYERWAAADAEEAWVEVLNYFNTAKDKYGPGSDTGLYASPSGDVQFSQIIADHLHASSNRECMFVPNDACDQIVDCSDQSGGATGVSSPAGYMIINSIANVHLLLDQTEDALLAAGQTFNGEASDMVSAFADLASSKQIKITIDALLLAVALVSAPFWNSWLKSAPGYNGDNASTLKDAVAGLVAANSNFIKDSLSTSDVFDTTFALQSLGAHMINAMRDVNTNGTAKQLFSGEDTTTLNELISGGASAALWSSHAPADTENNIYKALVASTIPTCWEKALSSDVSTSRPGFFIMTSEDISQDGTGCEGLDPSDYFDNEHVGVPSFVCGPDGQGYWLLIVGRFCSFASKTGVWTCFGYNGDGSAFTTVPGIEHLNSGVFGGLSLEDLVYSSVNAWIANGRQNGWSAIDLADPDADTVESVGDSGVRTPGVFNMPVCSRGEAALNWGGLGEKSANYPCN